VSPDFSHGSSDSPNFGRTRAHLPSERFSLIPNFRLSRIRPHGLVTASPDHGPDGIDDRVHLLQLHPIAMNKRHVLRKLRPYPDVALPASCQAANARTGHVSTNRPRGRPISAPAPPGRSFPD
jgi:hypothetical protein